MSLMKKRKLCAILILVGISIFFLSMLSFIILALLTNGNVSSAQLSLAWVLLILILLGSMLTVVSGIIYIIVNKERISDYLKKISKM